MPIHCPIATQRITQDEFKQIAGEVMQAKRDYEGAREAVQSIKRVGS